MFEQRLDTLTKILASLVRETINKTLEGNSVQKQTIQIIIVPGRTEDHRTEVIHQTETDRPVEESLRDLGTLLVERTTIHFVREDIRIEDHQEAIHTEVDPVTVSILRKRKAKENGNSTTKLVLGRYLNGTEAPQL